jgi:hypothetical protein
VIYVDGIANATDPFFCSSNLRKEIKQQFPGKNGMNADLEPVVNVPGNSQVMEKIVINPVFIDPDILVGDALVELFHQVFLKAVAAPGDVITRKTIAFSQKQQKIPYENVIADSIRLQHQQAFWPWYTGLAEKQDETGGQVYDKGEIP